MDLQYRDVNNDNVIRFECPSCGKNAVLNRCQCHKKPDDVCYPEHLKNHHLGHDDSSWAVPDDKPDEPPSKVAKVSKTKLAQMIKA